MAERKTAISKFAKLAKLGGAELPETDIYGLQVVKRHKFTPKYKFEQRFADKLKAKVAAQVTIDTTVMNPEEDHYGKYLALMKSYEDDLAELEA